MKSKGYKPAQGPRKEDKGSFGNKGQKSGTHGPVGKEKHVEASDLMKKVVNDMRKHKKKAGMFNLDTASTGTTIGY